MITVRHPAALSHANPGLGGIRTREGVIAGWPGQEPTQAQVNQWEAEWLVFINDPANSETTLDDVIRAAGLTPAQIIAAKRNR